MRNKEAIEKHIVFKKTSVAQECRTYILAISPMPGNSGVSAKLQVWHS